MKKRKLTSYICISQIAIDGDVRQTQPPTWYIVLMGRKAFRNPRRRSARVVWRERRPMRIRRVWHWGQGIDQIVTWRGVNHDSVFDNMAGWWHLHACTRVRKTCVHLFGFQNRPDPPISHCYNYFVYRFILRGNEGRYSFVPVCIPGLKVFMASEKWPPKNGLLDSKLYKYVVVL